jgi:hypothetical protein
MESSKPEINLDMPAGDRSQALVTPDAAASITLVSVTCDGLCFRSERTYEIGCQMQLGLHVRVRAPIGSHGVHPPEPSQGHFLEVNGFVIDSRMVTIGRRRLFEVTLLFDALPLEYRELLSKVPAADVMERAKQGELDYERFLLGGHAKRSGVVGLN